MSIGLHDLIMPVQLISQSPIDIGNQIKRDFGPQGLGEYPLQLNYELLLQILVPEKILFAFTRDVPVSVNRSDEGGKTETMPHSLGLFRNDFNWLKH